jgi:hypothetical protein
MSPLFSSLLYRKAKGGRMIKSKLLTAHVGVILIGIWIVFAHGYAHGEEDWILYGITKYFILFYDGNSITHPSKDIAELWIKSVSKCNDTKDWVIKDHPNCANVEWLYVLTLTQIDCSKKQDSDVRSIGYDKEGRESLSDETSEWSDIIPGSYADVLYRVVCP